MGRAIGQHYPGCGRGRHQHAGVLNVQTPWLGFQACALLATDWTQDVADEDARIIDRDLPRTGVAGMARPGQQERLGDVLRAMCAADPATGYVQGMHGLAARLLEWSGSAAHAFAAMRLLLEHRGYAYLYGRKLEGAEVRTFVWGGGKAIARTHALAALIGAHIICPAARRAALPQRRLPGGAIWRGSVSPPYATSPHLTLLPRSHNPHMQPAATCEPCCPSPLSGPTPSPAGDQRPGQEAAEGGAEARARRLRGWHGAHAAPAAQLDPERRGDGGAA